MKASVFLADFLKLETFSVAEDGTATSRIQILPEGVFEHPWYGTVNFSKPILEQLVNNYSAGVGNIQPSVDEEHRGGKALGWFTNIEYGKHQVNGKQYQGLFGTVNWTKLGQEYIKDGLYKYFSAEVSKYKDPSTTQDFGNVLYGGGLTNRPFFTMMHGVAEKAKFSRDEATTLFTDDQWTFRESTDDDTDSTFNPFRKVEKKVLFSDIMKELGLTFNSLEELNETFSNGRKAIASIDRLRTKATEAKIEFGDDVIGAVFSHLGKVVTSFDQAKEANVSLTERLGAVEKTLKFAAAGTQVDKFIADGKIVPAQREFMVEFAAETPERFSKMMETAPVVVKLGERGTSGKVEEPGSVLEFNAATNPDKVLSEVEKYSKILTGAAA